MKTVQQLYAEAKAVITEVPARDVHERMARGEPTVLIDIREQNEVNLGYPEGAILIGRGILEREVESRVRAWRWWVSLAVDNATTATSLEHP